MFSSIIENAGIIDSVHRFPYFNDEPKLYNFYTKINNRNNYGDGRSPDPNSSGVSFSEEGAFLKAFFEAIERYSNAYYLKSNFVKSSYKRIVSKRLALKPSQFCYFNTKQLQKPKYSEFNYSDNETYYWTDVTSSDGNKKTYVPAQLIYCPYRFIGEKTICLPVTTGAALGLSLEEALYKSICEVIERDSFSTTYLLKLKPKKIVYSTKSQEIRSIINIISKYELSMESYLLHSDFNIPTILSLIIDEKYNLPIFSLGLKTDYCLEKAIIGSIEESFQSRCLVKTRLLSGNFKGSTYTEQILFSRCKSWLSPNSLKYLDFIRKECDVIKLNKKQLIKNSRQSSSVKLNNVKKELKEKNIKWYYRDITHDKVKKHIIFVSKVLIPDLNPLTLDFEYPYCGGKRLTSLMFKHKVKKLNIRPHPFL